MPVQSNKERRTEISQDFGKSQCFALYDTGKKLLEFIPNPGQCLSNGKRLMGVLEYKDISTVLCHSMNEDDLKILNQRGIKAFRTKAECVEEILEHYSRHFVDEIKIG